MMTYFNTTKTVCMLVPASWKHYMRSCSTTFGQRPWKPVACPYMGNTRSFLFVPSCATRNSAQRVTFTSAANSQSQDAWVVVIFWVVLACMALFYSSDIMSGMDSVIKWAETLWAWDVKTMDGATANAAVKAAWRPALDEDGSPVVPSFVKEHLEKKGLPRPAKSAQPTPDVETKADGPRPALRTFTAPSWFPFGLCFRFQAHPFFITFASTLDSLRMPPTLGPSLLEEKNAEIAALKAELEGALLEINDRDEEMQANKLLVARTAREQDTQLTAAHKDLDTIRMHIREIGQKFRRLGDLNRTHVDQIGTLEEKTEELNTKNSILTTENEELQWLTQDLQRENQAWIRTMHALHDQDKDVEIERLRAQLDELETSHNHTTLSNLALQDSAAYLHRISAANAQATTTTQNNLHNALSRIDTLTHDLSTTSESLESALHETDMLRDELHDQEAHTARLTSTTQHEHSHLHHLLTEARESAATTQSQLERALDKKTRVLRAKTAQHTATARRCESLLKELNSEVRHSQLVQWELEWLRYAYDESTRYPQWECAGFGDGGVGVCEYDWNASVEVFGCESGSEGEYEEVVLADFTDRFEKLSCFSGEDKTESETEDEGLL
ncbi:hypothetical protein EKO04_002354 [Ascochyta lentis]|uniref:Uncharacterized protein n=1 Tax=Ascochyta lentis TaxID=205686 RepID=A0A8H7J9M0_9PLEO|nr:hypothetical protein EKO04_002354 [Ascochyta lentis]